MKKLIKNIIADMSIRGWILFIMLLIACVGNAENTVTRNGNTFTASSSSSSSRSTSKKTSYLYVDTDGKQYEIYITSNGRCYINKVSGKTGNTYKKYIPEDVARTICKEMNIEYKEKKK